MLKGAIFAAAGAGPVLALAACGETRIQTSTIAGADPGRGRQTIERLACGACHRIPGVPWPASGVGPPLDGFADRALIAGALPNKPQILVQWVRDAPSLVPATGMPAIPMTEQEARDVAAYLYTLGPR